MIVGNDQEGDDSVITAHVSLFAVSFFNFFPFFVSFFIKLFGKAKHCGSSFWNLSAKLYKQQAHLTFIAILVY